MKKYLLFLLVPLVVGVGYLPSALSRTSYVFGACHQSSVCTFYASTTPDDPNQATFVVSLDTYDCNGTHVAGNWLSTSASFDQMNTIMNSATCLEPTCTGPHCHQCRTHSSCSYYQSNLPNDGDLARYVISRDIYDCDNNHLTGGWLSTSASFDQVTALLNGPACY